MKRSARKRILLRGYPIPPDRQKYVIWQNDTPHLSPTAAYVHSQVLGEYTYKEFVETLHAYLSPLLDGSHREWCDEARAIALQGPEKIATEFARATRAVEGADPSFMMDKLVTDEPASPDDHDPLVTDPDFIEAKLFKWLDTLGDHPLDNYERKMARKYLGSGSARTAQGYIKQINENYRYTRPQFVMVPMPQLSTYEAALLELWREYSLPPRILRDGQPVDPRVVGFLRRARTTTFGGHPFLRNMADFVSKDESDPTTYADLYNRLAVMYLFLPPAAKIRWAYDFVALERVQHGGADNVAFEDDDTLKYSQKANKQRFVQAQSAVLSHAYKLLADLMLNRMRSTQPKMVADKFGEQYVSTEMKLMVKHALADHSLSCLATTRVGVLGTDYTNYDAHQGVEMSNDTLYQCWRLMSPACFTEYLIDPYVKAVYREARILTPVGYLQTTGVRSGMVDTNETDTVNCHLADIYELYRYAHEHNIPFDDPRILECLQNHMDNGDDRFKLTLLDAADVERYDWELGFIAQKEKQELFSPGTPMSQLGVTYLKTILCLDPRDERELLRTDAISKLVMSRLRPEDNDTQPRPATFLVSCVMSAARSTESPYLYVLVDFMYHVSDLFRQLVSGEIGWEQVSALMVVEQLERLVLQRGRTWLRRKGTDVDAVIEQMNLKWGYGDEGHRGDGGLQTSTPDAGLGSLPASLAILSVAHQRVRDGVIGSTFN